MIKNLFPTILKQLFAISFSLMFIKLKKFNTDFNLFFKNIKQNIIFLGQKISFLSLKTFK